jgi:heme-degrading monooxygenase HmoA
MSRRIIRMSERFVAPMMEFKVKEIMQKVEKEIRGTKGLQRIETLVDRNDPNRHIVVTEWVSRKYLNDWLESDLCKQTIKDLDTVLDRRVSYREFVHHEDDVFLL